MRREELGSSRCELEGETKVSDKKGQIREERIFSLFHETVLPRFRNDEEGFLNCFENSQVNSSFKILTIFTSFISPYFPVVTKNGRIVKLSL